MLLQEKGAKVNRFDLVLLRDLDEFYSVIAQYYLKKRVQYEKNWLIFLLNTKIQSSYAT